ncbi:MAG: DUF5644 domain-containing protein [Wolinella sp.]
MATRLEIELVRFCAQRDYLPYRSRVEVSVESCEREGLLELFGYIRAQIPDFGFDKEIFGCKINNRTLYKDVKIAEIVAEFGRCFVLAPLSQRHAVDDLCIDSRPYKLGISKLNGVIELSEEDKKLYDSLLPLAFASGRAISDGEYLGEAFFVFIAEMIRRHPEAGSALISLLLDADNGVMSALPLGERIFPYNSRFDDDIFGLQRKILSGYPAYSGFWVRIADEIKEVLKGAK